MHTNLRYTHHLGIETVSAELFVGKNTQ